MKDITIIFLFRLERDRGI